MISPCRYSLQGCLWPADALISVVDFGGYMKKLLFILLLAATVAHAVTYKWIDSEGTVHFSESLGEIPATYRKNARPLEMNTSRNGDGGIRQDPGAARSESGQNAGENSGVPT